MKVAIQAALGARQGIKIYGSDYLTIDGTCVRDFVHVSDLADAHLAVLDHLRGGRPSCTVNCGYGSGYSVRQVVETVQKIAGSFSTEFTDRRPGDPTAIVADNRKLLGMGWKPRLNDLETIVRDAVNWEKKRIRLLGEARPATDTARP